MILVFVSFCGFSFLWVFELICGFVVNVVLCFLCGVGIILKHGVFVVLIFVFWF